MLRIVALGRLGCRLLAGALLAAGIVACGASGRPEPASHTVAAPVRPSPTAAAAGDAGPVALAYLRAIIRNDYDAALPLVVPSQREIVKALALGQGPGTLPKLSAEVAVGEVVVAGDTATVSIVGRMCRTEAHPSGPAPPADCVENEDPKTDLPVFLIHLTREHAKGWKVVYDFQAPDAQGG